MPPGPPVPPAPLPLPAPPVLLEPLELPEPLPHDAHIAAAMQTSAPNLTVRDVE
ncbi:hypothetical protein [Trinickia sp.]|uniref:hypothetical protein n=1 Tax=Trinickia sp. TaxID=2571163 RepID=UPI003F7FEF8A